MTSSKKKIIWGLILLVLTVGLIFWVFVPDLGWPRGIALWKWFVGAVLLYWLINNAVFGKRLVDHFDVFLPLSLLFAVFRSDLSSAIGKDLSFISRWSVIGIAVLLTIALHLLLDNVKYVHREGDKSSEKIAVDATDSSNSFKSSIDYFDLSQKKSFSVTNRMGETEVFFQNMNLVDLSEPVRLNLSNSFGELIVHVPPECKVTTHLDVKFGADTMRPNPDNPTWELLVFGVCRFGEVRFSS